MKKILFLLLIAVSATAQSVEITPNSTKSINSGGIYSANPTTVATYPVPTPTAPVSGAGTRLMWIPSRSAFRVGSVNGAHWDADSIGLFSMAMGYNTTASGSYSTAMGAYNTASGEASTAMGGYSIASGGASTAMGYNTTASGGFSTAMGYYTMASGSNSTAMGWNTAASGGSSTTMGYRTTASGIYSTAIGYLSTASGNYSTAMGSRVNTNTKTGAFMIGDEYNGATQLNASTTNRFYARFRSGYALYTNATNTIGVQLGANGNAWTTISDSTRKENFLPAHTEAVLQSVAQMRVGTWNYKGQDPAQYRHWGVMAQDFYRHFGKDPYGTIGNDTTITTADFDGVAFAALKGLEARTRALATRNSELETKYSLLTTHYSELKSELAELRKLLTARTTALAAKSQ